MQTFVNVTLFQYHSDDIIFFITGAPWISQAANKRIIQAAKTVIEVEKIENLLGIVL